MAKVITMSVALTLAGDGANLGGSTSLSANQSGAGGIGNVQNVGTSAEAISFGDATVTAGGAFLVINTDPTNYVEVDCVNTFNSGAQQKLTPGAFTILRPEAATWYAKANTAACNCIVVAVTA